MLANAWPMLLLLNSVFMAVCALAVALLVEWLLLRWWWRVRVWRFVLMANVLSAFAGFCPGYHIGMVGAPSADADPW